MKKLRVDQKIIVIAYALDLLMPFLISYGTYLKGNSLAWLTLGIINLAIFHRFNVQSIIEMPTIFICIVLCLLIQVFIYYKNKKFA